MEIKVRASDEEDFRGRRERKAATKNTEKRTKLKKAHHANRKVSRVDQRKSLHISVHVH